MEWRQIKGTGDRLKGLETEFQVIHLNPINLYLNNSAWREIMSFFYLENGTILSISFKVSTAYVLKSREILNEEPFDITMPVPLFFAHIGSNL